MSRESQGDGDILDRLQGPRESDYSAADDEVVLAGRRKWKLRGAGIFAAIALLLLIKGSCRQSEKVGAVTEKADLVVHSAEVLGIHIARELPGAKILVVTEPKWSADYRKELIKATVNGLKRGLDGKGSIEAIDAPELPEALLRESVQGPDGAGKPQATWIPPLDCWLSADVFSTVLRRHEQCTLVVSMIGLPPDFARTYLTPGATPPDAKLAVLSGPLPEAKAVAFAFEKGLIIGIVVDQPPQKEDPRPAGLPLDLETDFSSRHVLLTKKNILHYAGRNRSFFGPR